MLKVSSLWICVHAADGDTRSIDLDCYWMPIGEPVILAGAEGKSYGVLTLRYAPRTNTVITTPLGTGKDDLQMTALPWADLSGWFTGAVAASGAAIFVDPRHPDYPPTWLTRHYGALCLGWPGSKSGPFRPGNRFTVPIVCGSIVASPRSKCWSKSTRGIERREARWE